jgi:hypothetical protein
MEVQNGGRKSQGNHRKSRKCTNWKVPIPICITCTRNAQMEQSDAKGDKVVNSWGPFK